MGNGGGRYPDRLSDGEPLVPWWRQPHWLEWCDGLEERIKEIRREESGLLCPTCGLGKPRHDATVSEKWCPGCGKVKVAGAFDRDRRNGSGLQSRCRVCRKLHEITRARETMAERRCEFCGVPFRARRPGSKQRYHSIQCANRARIPGRIGQLAALAARRAS